MSRPISHQGFRFRGLALLALFWLAACADVTPAPAKTCDQIQCDPGFVCIAGTCRVSSPNDPRQDAPRDEPDLPEDLPDEPDLPDTPDLSDEPDLPDTSEEPDMSDVEDPDLPDTPDEPDMSDVEDPDLPDTPDEPDMSEEPDLPDTSEEPDLPDTSEEPDTPDEPCAVARAEAEQANSPVDIVWIVDNSGSMNHEEELVEEEINDFARSITQSRIDYRVVMISGSQVCVPAPLSSGGCPDQDSETYRHVHQIVSSDDSLRLAWETWPQYADFLRPNAKVHFVVVTDDNSRASASRFVVEMTDRGVPDDFTFHSVVAYGDTPFLGCCGFTGCGAGIGSTYLSLSQMTGGVIATICQENWGEIFNSIASSVVESTILPCQYDIPEPGEFMVIDPEEINVVYTPDTGEPVVLPNVDDAADCNGNTWYYDDPVQPRNVILCPEACGAVGGRIDIEFGCDIVKQ